jgi:hypothetical protein
VEREEFDRSHARLDGSADAGDRPHCRRLTCTRAGSRPSALSRSVAGLACAVLTHCAVLVSLVKPDPRRPDSRSPPPALPRPGPSNSCRGPGPITRVRASTRSPRSPGRVRARLGCYPKSPAVSPRVVNDTETEEAQRPWSKWANSIEPSTQPGARSGAPSRGRRAGSRRALEEDSPSSIFQNPLSGSAAEPPCPGWRGRPGRPS